MSLSLHNIYRGYEFARLISEQISDYNSVNTDIKQLKQLLIMYGAGPEFTVHSKAEMVIIMLQLSTYILVCEYEETLDEEAPELLLNLMDPRNSKDFDLDLTFRILYSYAEELFDVDPSEFILKGQGEKSEILNGTLKLPASVSNIDSKKEEEKMITPKSLVEELKFKVIGNESAKQAVAVHLFKYQLTLKSNTVKHTNPILITGGSGTGKTYITNLIAADLGIKMVTMDCSILTKSGYKGYNLTNAFYDIYVELLQADKIEKGVKGAAKATGNVLIFLDEFDKCMINPEFNIQHELLKVLETGKIIATPSEKGQDVALDLSNCCFILAGAFSWIRQKKKKSINVGSDSKESKLEINHKTLIDEGMLAELVGRITKICHTEPTQDLVAVMKSRNNVKDHYTALFEAAGINRKITDKDLKEIAKKSAGSEIGMRQLWTSAAEYFETDFYI